MNLLIITLTLLPFTVSVVDVVADVSCEGTQISALRVVEFQIEVLR